MMARLLKRLEVLEQRCPSAADPGTRERIVTAALRRLSRADLDLFISGAEAHQEARELTGPELAARDEYESALELACRDAGLESAAELDRRYPE